jgi:putative glutamine amidotransferase
MRNEPHVRPRIGIPYRTRNEEVKNIRSKFENYLRAVEQGGGLPVEISLGLSRAELEKQARSLDAVILPGSPADVNPALYHMSRHAQTAEADSDRERTDLALLEHALGEGKPVLAVCYGIQILNVHLGGSLIQDIEEELHTAIQHPWAGSKEGKPEPEHLVRFEGNSRIIQLAGATEGIVNSSHHQAIHEPGRNLRIVGRAPDGVVEAVEWTGDSNWVTGVQWHPERMGSDTLALALFQEFIKAARLSAVRE